MSRAEIARDITILASAIAAGIISSYIFIGFLAPEGMQGVWGLSSGGNVKTVGVGIYWDINCNETVSYLDWGIVEPGSSGNITIYIRNEGNADMVLSFNTSNWTPPAASQYIALGWDYDGMRIQPDEVIQVTFTIALSPSIGDIKIYEFDLQITGTS